MTGYAKLSSALVTSTVWRESATTRVVWITMLSLADRHGEVQGSVPGLADLARVTVPECRTALTCFLSPDPDSRTKAHGGCRVEEIDGGWALLNYAKFRDLYSAEHRRELGRARAARHRAKKVTQNNANNDKQYAVRSKQIQQKKSASAAFAFGDPEHQAAYDAYRAEHRAPDAMDALLAKAGQSGAAIGATLADMRAAGARFAPRTFAGFAKKIRTPPPDHPARSPVEASAFAPPSCPDCTQTPVHSASGRITGMVCVPDCQGRRVAGRRLQPERRTPPLRP